MTQQEIDCQKKMDQMKELVRIYEKILHGDENHDGLFDYNEWFYEKCWDNHLIEIERLKKQLKLSL